MKNHRALILSLLIGLTTSAAADDVDTYLWSNEGGLQKADMSQCKDTSSQESGFRVADVATQEDVEPDVVAADQWFFDNRCGTRRHPFFCESVKVKGRSLLKVVDGKKYDDYLLVNLTGVNKDPSEVLNDNEWAFRNFEGYMRKDRLQPVEKYVLQITDEATITKDNGEKIELGEIPGTDITFVQALLQPAVTRQGYRIFKCGSKKYTIFELLYEEGDEPVARIGVDDDDTKILRNLKVIPAHVVVEAGQESEDEQSDQPTTPAPATPAVNSGSTSVTVSPTTPSTPPASEVVAPVPHVRQWYFSPYAEVVCMPSATQSANIVDESLTKSLFTLKNGTEIKIFQPFYPPPAGSTPPQYTRIQVVDGGKVGWILTSQRAQAGGCASLEAAAPAADAAVDVPATDTQPAVVREPLPAGEYVACTEDGGQVKTYDLEFNALSGDKYLDPGAKVTLVDGTQKDKPTPNGHGYVSVKTEAGDTILVASDLLIQGKCSTSLEEILSGVVVDGYVFPVFQPTGYSYLAASKRPFQHSAYVYKNGKPLAGYSDGWGMYGASRSRGKRGHAATDLYQPRGWPLPEGKGWKKSHYGGPFRAMADGRMLRKPHGFYLGTDNMPVLNTDGTISRYGEIYAKREFSGTEIKAGQLLGHVCWVGAGDVPPMLHFENYDAVKYSELIDKASNNDNGLNCYPGVKVNGRSSKRCEGLFNRTIFMQKLEFNTFGNKERQE